MTLISSNKTLDTRDDAAVDFVTADWIERLIYIICLIIGGPLNVVSLLSTVRRYIRKQKLRSQFLLLRMHLNIADSITLFVYALTQTIWLSTYQWYGGDVLCRICKFFYTFSFYLNSFVNSGIAVDRACNTYNMHSRRALKAALNRVRKMIAAAYVSASLFSTPQLFIFRLFSQPGQEDFKQCSPIWTIYKYELFQKVSSVDDDYQQKKQIIEARLNQIKKWETANSVIHLLLVFWIPSLIITLSYIVVIYKLKTFPARKEKSLLSDNQSKGNVLADLSTIKESRSEYDAELSQIKTVIDEIPPKTTDIGEVLEISSIQLPRAHSSELVMFETETSSCISSSARTQLTIRRATKIAKYQAAVILLTYLSLWTPYNLMALISILAPLNSSFNELLYWTLPFLNALIVVNTVINPLIYGFFEKRKDK